MNRGPRPKPVEQKIREGNPGHRRLPEPILVGGRPTEEELAEPPEHLPPDAKRLWREDIATLVETGIADRVDRTALEGLCIAYARACQAGRVIASEGLFAVGSVGNLRPHPAVKIEQDAWHRFYAMAEHFALTPVARTRLGQAELGRRSLAAELGEKLGDITLQEVDVVDAEVVE
jgi:P27 family predicted phage terminase small subunit